MTIPVMWLVELIKLPLHEDARGWFMEGWKPEILNQKFEQENIVYSKRGVLRGMHMQAPPQGKFVRCLQGMIYDVVADTESRAWRSYTLTPGIGLWVPPIYAHGYQVLSEEAIVSYLVTAGWNKEGEISIRYDDPALAIWWPIGQPILSPKDSV